MKIILLPNNTASLMSTTIPRLRSLGLEAIGFNFAPTINDSRDNIEVLPSSFFSRIIFFFKFLHHLYNSDAVHWIYGSGSKNALLIMKMVSLVKRNKFVEFCGSDVRSLEKMCSDIPFFAFDSFSTKLKKQLGTKQSSLRTQYRFSNCGFKAMPNSPELVDYMDKDLYKDFYLISRSIELNSFPFIGVDENKKVPLVIHMPSNPEVKGSKYFQEAAEKLQKQNLIEYKLISGVAHSEAIKLLKSADIVVDQLIIGEYGVLAIEAMAFGKPVICFIRPKVKDYYQKYFDNFPIVNANIHTIEEVLINLVKDVSLRKKLSFQGREFAVKYHDSHKNAVNLSKIYNGEIAPQKVLF